MWEMWEIRRAEIYIYTYVHKHTFSALCGSRDSSRPNCWKVMLSYMRAMEVMLCSITALSRMVCPSPAVWVGGGRGVGRWGRVRRVTGVR
jgi:hypothetical protein